MIGWPGKTDNPSDTTAGWAMRDPMSWALPVFRAFGIQVRVHLFFFVVTLGLYLRQVTAKDSIVSPWDVFAFTVLLLFFIILIHEFGHCFGGRAVGGEANEILIWPLGGLAFVDVPQTPRAHNITVAAGPGVNLAICILTGVIICGAGFLPKLNPISSPYVCEMTNYREGRTYSSEYGIHLYKPGTAEEASVPSTTWNTAVEAIKSGKTQAARDAFTAAHVDWAVAPSWLVWLQRTFWLSWVLFLFNLIPAYPLDGGQLLQGFVWARSNYRQGTVVACYSGYVVGVLFIIGSIALNETLLMGLGLFMFYESFRRLAALDSEEGAFGYDFSQGYTSLERDDPPPTRPKRGNWFKRWMQARTARRLQREAEQRVRDDERMDELLDKIAKTGKASLTDEERRFMERVSARYRNR